MAEDLTAPEAEQPAQAETPPSPVAARKHIALDSESPEHFRHQFRFVYVVLAVGLAAAIAGAILAAGSSITGSTAWSSWKPDTGGLSAARQIAQHVAPSYRLPGGAQLVDVIAKEPSVTPGTTTIPVHYLAVRETKAQGGDQILSISSSNSVMFSMCGLGPSCSIATGTPSVARGRLVRREILELALYTFKYVGGIKNVIAFMPPQPGSTPQYVVYLRKDDLSSELRQPLDETLAAKTPLASAIPAKEVRTVDATTESRTFSFSLSQAQQGDAILVLAPLKA
ncbi:MAG TPA: hypothetical protein VHD91_04550 [Gaiellaceae bacterium]|nr:hypothetical protein [Gaiellaceae bacterium]